MNKQRKIPAGLINDIAGDLHESLGVLSVPNMGSQRLIVRQVIEKTVYRVLFAVDDGELDKALEVVKRAESPESRPIDICSTSSPFSHFA